MATSKSTVVGIRLDHDRRAWVEAEAARRGVSMRGLFEGMIDEARQVGPTEASQAIAGLGSAAATPTTAQAPNAAAEEAVAPATAPLSSSTSSPWVGVGAVTAVPTGLIREALSLTASLIELSGRLATNRLESCVLTRHCGRRSL